MIKAARIALSLAAVAGVGATFAACGGVPGNAVATVDGEAIEKQEFTHWMTVAAKSSGQPNAAVPDPEADYAKCVAAKRKATPAPAKGQPKVTDSQLKTQCKTGVRAAAQPGPPAPDLLPVDPGRGRRDGDQGHRRRGQEVLRRAEEAELPEGSGLQEVHPDSPARPRRTSSSASSSTCCRTRSATRSSRARTRSPTRRSRTSTTRTRPASPSPRSATCASC